MIITKILHTNEHRCLCRLTAEKKRCLSFLGWFLVFCFFGFFYLFEQNSLLNHSLIKICSFLFFCLTEIGVLNFSHELLSSTTFPIYWKQRKHFYWWFSTMQNGFVKNLLCCFKDFFSCDNFLHKLNILNSAEESLCYLFNSFLFPLRNKSFLLFAWFNTNKFNCC